MNYFVTGATGFIGRHLVAELLKRDGTIHALVREGSRGKLDALAQRLGAPEGKIVAVAGDLSKPGLGVENFDQPIDHLFHLAAVYDIEADEESSERANVEGTQHVVEFANAHEVGRFHHVSSIAVAGNYEGIFQEDMFDEGQKLPHHYHRTKYESERLVREGVETKTLVYRPGIVVGHSETGEMDKIDGPYYFFKLLQKLRHALPGVVPARRPRGRADEHRSGGLRGARDGPHLPPAGRRAARRHLPPGEPGAHDGGSDAERVRQGGARPPVRAARGPEPDERRSEAGARGPHGAADGQADPQPALPRHRRSPGRDGEPRLPREVRRARQPARAQRYRHRRAPAVHVRAAAVGLLGAQPRPGPVPRPLARQRGQGQARPDHGRLQRHRPRDRGEGRRGRRHRAARLAHAREARGGGEAGGGARRDRARPPGGPLGPRGHRQAGRRGARAARRRGRAREQRGSLDPPLGRALVRPLPRLRAHHAAELLRRAEADPRVHAGDARAQVRPHHQRELDRGADEHAALLGVRCLEVRARRVLPLHGPRGGGRQREVHHRLHAARAHPDDRARRTSTRPSRRSRRTRPR